MRNSNRKIWMVTAASLAALWISRNGPQAAPPNQDELAPPARQLARATTLVGEAYRIHAVKGQPIRVEFLDGSHREARVQVTHGGAESVRVAFQITDNTCSPDRGMTCRLSLPMRRHRLRLVWTANPVQAKMGQTVKWAKSNTSVLDYTIQASAGFREKFPTLTANLPPESIQCEDDRWLPSNLAEAPRIHLVSWSTKLAPQPDTNPSLEIFLNNLELSCISAGDRQVAYSDPATPPKRALLGIIDRVVFQVQLPTTLAPQTSGALQSGITEVNVCEVTGSRESLQAHSAELNEPIRTPLSTDQAEDYLFESDEAIDSGGIANLEQMLYDIAIGETGRVPRDLD